LVDELVSHQYVKAGTYEVALAVAKNGDDQSIALATIKVVVEPGLLHRIVLEPSNPSVMAADQEQFTVTAFDRFGNIIPGLASKLSVNEVAGQIGADGVFTASTKAAHYEAAVTAVVTQGPATKTATVDVIVEPGLLTEVRLKPETVELNIGESQEFTATAVDVYGNPLRNARLTWRIDQRIGTISSSGLVTAGSMAGFYENGVTAAILSEEASASVTVNPDAPANVTIPAVLVAAGEPVTLKALVVDQYGNPAVTSDIIWSVGNPKAGSITSPNMLTAGVMARTYPEAIQAVVRPGGLTASVAVTIVPGPLDRVLVAPDAIEIGIRMTQQYVAAGVDRFGNRISGLDITWSLNQDIGTIDTSGLFSAANAPATQVTAIKAMAIQNNLIRSGEASITVEPDNVAFISDRNDGQLDVYVMNMDGSNVRRVTTGAAPKVFSWSPDGRRIVSDFDFFDSRYIVSTNDDGIWDVLLTDSGVDGDPDWSPNGGRVAYASKIDGNSEIYVMDVDGGNPVRVTNHSAKDQNPAWSPDGEKILFTSDRDGNQEIYVLSLTGGGITRLTNRTGTDSHPRWSPDGSEILFTSSQDGDSEIYLMNWDGTDVRKLTSNRVEDTSPSWSPDGRRIIFASGDKHKDWEIYTMSRVGDQIDRLTDNKNLDLAPRWAPRKRGVEVNQASVVIPQTGSRTPLTEQDAVDFAINAVVRIEAGSRVSSGFIIDPDGLILTSNHVTRDSEVVTVSLRDGSSYNGTVLGRDLLRNLAMIRIDARDLPWLELADAGQAEIGSEVLALGYTTAPDSIRLISGVVSDLKVDAGRNIRWLEIDVPLGWEYNGGPVLNLYGEVAGVVDAKTVSGTLDSSGLVIAANTINVYLERLKAGEIIAN
jgi:Tol biopolymer transport system component